MSSHPSQRLLVLDGARGLALLLMTLNHFLILVLPRSGLISFTGDALGYVSMAEVFFFLGGFSTFVAYSGLHSPSVDPGTKRSMLWNRIRVLCVAEIWIVLGYCVATGCPPFNLAAFSSAGTSTKALIPVGLDILPVHIFILIFLGLFFEKLRKVEVRRILLFSAAIWVCAWSVGSLARTEPSIQIPSLIFFNPLAAQLLYAMGYATAYSVYSGGVQVLRQRLLAPWATLSVCLAVVFFFSMKRFDLFRIDSLPAMTSRPDFGPVRILNFLVLGALALRISAHISFEKVLSPFCLMGRRCLPLFAITTVGIYALQPFTLPRVGEAQSAPLVRILFIAFTLGIVAQFLKVIRRPSSSSS